jgi:bacillithiol system protein YtxJ
MRDLETTAELDTLLDAPVALLYKHSDRCPISAMAREEIATLLRERPDAPVWLLEVNTHRELSGEVARRLEVEHQSPQAILLVQGRPAWQATHFQVRADAMARQLDAAGDQSAAA